MAHNAFMKITISQMLLITGTQVQAERMKYAPAPYVNVGFSFGF